MSTQFTFHLLDSVDSTNNYAMEQIRAGMAENGMAWQARHQSAGKGQLGRAWISEMSDNILMSIIVKPRPDQMSQPFMFNMLIALVCADFIGKLTNETVTIKWPNDIYINDRKAGGVLIENIFRGKEWQWAIIGLGLNINQSNFPKETPKAVSLFQITGNYFDPIALARELHQTLSFELIHSVFDPILIQNRFHEKLYKCNKWMEFEKEGVTFTAQIKGVDENGHLLTDAGTFKNGEIKWL